MLALRRTTRTAAVTAAALLASLFVGLSTAGAETVPTAVQFNMHGANGSASGHNTNVG